MKVEHGKIEGDLRLDYDLFLRGKVTGNITIVKGGNLVLLGMCEKNIIVEAGAEAYLHGTVVGNVLNQGGYLEVYGTTGGHVDTTEDGTTFIDPNAIVSRGSTLGG